MKSIRNTTALNAWKDALEHVLKRSRVFTDSDNRTCHEVFGLQVVIEDPKDITAPITVLNSFETWVYPSLEELQAVILSKDPFPGLVYSYGQRLFDTQGVNQIDEYVIPLLKNDSASRRATLVLYHPPQDAFVENKEVPGVVMINCNMVEGVLHITGIIRSNDVFFGWPANVYQLSVIQEYIAKKLQAKKGSITTYAVSAHVFEDQIDAIEKVIAQKTINKDP